MGGQVLNVIAVVIFIMWMLILERIAYFQSELKTLKATHSVNLECKNG